MSAGGDAARFLNKRRASARGGAVSVRKSAVFSDMVNPSHRNCPKKVGRHTSPQGPIVQTCQIGSFASLS